jgi:hypothetical protein
MSNKGNSKKQEGKNSSHGAGFRENKNCLQANITDFVAAATRWSKINN